MSRVGKLLAGLLIACAITALAVAAGRNVSLIVAALALVLLVGRRMPPNPTTRAEQGDRPEPRPGGESGDGGER